MTRTKTPGVPQGLPARFTDPKGGFVQLCKVLEIANRQQQQAILSTDVVKRAVRPWKAGAHKLPTAQRVRMLLTAFYSLPDERRKLWRHKQAAQEEAHEVRSLEYYALCGYDAEFTARDLEDERLGEALAEFPGAVESIADTPEWQRLVLAIWPDLRRDLIEWDTLLADRRDAVALAVFAVATILDDSRFLYWASARVDALADEFAFVRAAEEEEVDQGAMTPEESGAGATEPIGEVPGANMSDVIQEWKQLCAAVADCALTLGGDPPQPEHLQDLRQHVRALEQLSDPVVAIRDASRREYLVETVADTVATLADKHAAPWLRDAVDQIHTQWKLTYLAADGVAAEQLHADIARVERELPEAVGEWRRSQDKCASLATELQEIRERPRGDLASQLNVADQEATLHAAIAKTTTLANECRRTVLRAVSPEGHEFESSRDYAREWLDVTSPADTALADVVPDAKRPPVGRDDTEETAKANEAENIQEAGIQLVPSPEAERFTESGSKFGHAIAVLWQLVDERPGIAYHMARWLAEGDCSDPSLPLADLVAGMTLADSVQSADSAVVETLRPILERIEGLDLSRQDAQLQDALNLMLFCATLRPALLAPMTGAASLLRRVAMSNKLTSVAKFAGVVANHAVRLQGVRLDGTLLKAASSTTAWEEKFADLLARVEKWRDKAGKQHILLARVWMHWLQKDGCLGHLTGLIANDDASAKREVEQILERFSDRKELSALVKATDLGQVSSRALTQLQTHVRPVCDLGAAWLRLMDVKPYAKGFIDRNLDKLRRDLGQYGQPVLQVLDVCRTESAPPLRAAAAQARRSADGLLRILDDDRPDEVTDTDRVEETSKTILSRDLLYVTKLDLDVEFKPTNGQDAEEMVDLLADTGAHAPTMREAFYRRLQRGNVAGASLAYDELDKVADPEVDRCMSALEREVRDRHSTLIKELAQLKEETEQAFCFGQLSDQERNHLADRIVRVESALNGADSIERGQVDIGEIRQSIESFRAEMLARIRERFRAVSDDYSGDVRDRIKQCIDDGYLLVANELISQVDNTGTVASFSADQDDSLREFMSAVEKEGEAGDGADNLKPNAIVRAAKERGRVAGVTFELMSQAEAEQAADLLNVWYRLSTAWRIDDSTDLDELLLLLGFQVRKQKKLGTGRGWAEMSVETDVIQDRSICPLPHFGSESKGRYRLLLNWAQPVSESIARTIGRGVGDPTIVVHFGRLGPDREKLRQLALTKQQQFLVIDESLVLYLSARRTERLSTLFRCTLPFAAVDPYVTTSGLVPPELFYGRAHERQSIMDRFGACFIYGGRQLGKTALLRTVERDFHNPRERHLAKWIDLKVGEIGSIRPPDEIWSLLWRELHDLPVLSKIVRPPTPKNQAHVEAMIGEVEKWINARDDRRFLLLLDEADAFLAADARTDFRESTRLKGLMDRTDRRFKVVLAGLHNVLRTTERSNHPLAHFGEPICVGPLLTNGEWEQAQKLLRDPLRSVGCRFERDALGTLVLAQTNYYPSLIQLYGAELVRRLRDSTKPFPYVVTSKDVDATYRDTGLRSAIRERFLWTLQLDQRYEVVAYALAYDLLSSDANIDDGVDGLKIAASARFWWPSGFYQTTDSQFSVLLDEMVGLGVLRSVDDAQRYALRNPNILLLLGNTDDIERALLKEREVQDSLDLSTVRPQYDHPKSGRKKYAPLTHEQMHKLMDRGGVTVISGSRNGHIDLVAEYLARHDSQPLAKHPLKKIGDFESALGGFRPPSTDVTNVVLVPPDTPWTAEWLKAAKGVLKRKKRGRWIRLVLLADPETLWRVMGEPDPLKQIDIEGCVIIRPYDAFLGRWLDDNQLPSDPGHRQELLEVTGGWPVVLEEFIRRRRNNEWKKRIEGMENDLRKSSKRDMLLRDFGITSSDVERGMRTLCKYASEYGEETVADIADEAQMDASAVRCRMKWSELLGLVTRASDGWTFNPLVTRLLADE